MLIRNGIVAACTVLALVTSQAQASTAIGSWQESMFDETSPLPRGRRPLARSESKGAKQPREKITVTTIAGIGNEVPSDSEQDPKPEGGALTPSSELLCMLASLELAEQ